MIKNINALDLKQFSAEIEEIKQELMNSENIEMEDSEEAMMLEIINVVQEEIAKRKNKMKDLDIKSNVRFLAYLNLFTSMMDGGLDEDLDEDFDEDEEYEEEEDDDDK
jgi:hypothetical protein